MALIKCEECKKEISDSAKQCPHCGYKKRKNIKLNKVIDKFKNNKKAWLVIVGLSLLMFIIIIALLCLPSEKKMRKEW